jgi:hypothetical protein
MREEHLGDPEGARADYARYLAEHPTGSFAEHAQQGLERLRLAGTAP